MTQPAAGACNTLSDPARCTGKERDAESGNDYFGARYYASTMGRFLSPDWSAKEEPVPYAKLDNPQTLNLYNYMRNNPLGGVDADGHQDCLVCLTTLPPITAQEWKDFANDPYVQGTGQIALGTGLVGTAAFGDAPGGAAGALLLFNATLGGVATGVSGVAQIAGAATNTDTSEAQKVLSAVSTGPGLVATAASGGNLEVGEKVSTVTNAATLVANPKDAVASVPNAIDAAKTVKENTSLLKETAETVKNWINPPPPSPPAAPKPPGCSVAGACN